MKIKINEKTIKLLGNADNYFYDGTYWRPGPYGSTSLGNDLYNARALQAAGAIISDADLFCWSIQWDAGSPSNNAYAGVIIALDELGAVPVDDEPVPVWGHDI